MPPTVRAILQLSQLEGNRGLAALLFAGGALLLIALLIIRMRRQQAQRRHAYRPPRERLATIRKDAAQRDDLHTTMADVEELTRRCAAHLDNKAARLEYLITLADDRLARLEASASGEPVPTSPAAYGEDPTAPLADLRPDQEGPPPPTRRQMEQRATRTARADAAPNVFDAAPIKAGDGLPSPVITEPPDDPLTRRVYQMADRGAEPVEIAQTLDEQVGKVELILALRSA
ncbi:MAG: hypothetical protein KAS72_05500 [Phycisphaerales bacterium]|nr:hypothetical protein [Phycisphaerales bacterium]